MPQMSDFFLAQMDESSTKGMCFDNRKEGKRDRRFGGPPFCEDQRRLAYAPSGRGKAKGRSQLD